MSEYKRLTGQKWTDDIDLTKEYRHSYIYKRLYELEDKLESGRLVELPCKVNSTVYIVRDLRVIESKVRTIFFGLNGAEMIRTQHYDIPFRNWGKTLFLTREEAEKALDDMKNEDENERLQDKNQGV